VVLGEVGLAGEIRSVSQVGLRINEAEKLGFKHCILAKNNHRNLALKKSSIELIPVSTLKEALDIILIRK
jgi:DNA repair protein RadA/Sms